MALLDDERRARYAEAIVSTCLGLSEGEYLLITGEPAHRELIVALNAAAYRLGARLVDSVYADPLVRRARIEHAAEDSLGQVGPWSLQQLRALVKPDAAIVGITGEESPACSGTCRPSAWPLTSGGRPRSGGSSSTPRPTRRCASAWSGGLRRPGPRACIRA